MKNFLAALLLVPTLSFATLEHFKKDVICEDEDKLMAELTGPEYQEEVVIIGKGSVNVLIITLNKETGSYSVLEVNDGKLCGLNVGDNFTINWKKMPTQK
jgi:hypothetical protein